MRPCSYKQGRFFLTFRLRRAPRRVATGAARAGTAYLSQIVRLSHSSNRNDLMRQRRGGILPWPDAFDPTPALTASGEFLVGAAWRAGLKKPRMLLTGDRAGASPVPPWEPGDRTGPLRRGENAHQPRGSSSRLTWRTYLRGSSVLSLAMLVARRL